MMEIERLKIDDDLVEYLSSKGDVQKFINFCIRERKETIEKDYRKKMAVPPSAAEKRKVDADYREFKQDVTDDRTPFYRKNVVITGTFGRFEDRNALSALLWEYGAAVKSGITGNTDVVVMGSGAGPKKRELVRELQAGGKDILVLDEDALYGVISEYGMAQP